MVTRDMLTVWIIDALRANRGSAQYADIGKHIWKTHEEELRNSGDMFYVWQYDLRWVCEKLKKNGVVTRTRQGQHSIIVLNA